MKKVNLYNKTGKLETVYVFTGTDKNLTESEMGLSDIEKAEISKIKQKSNKSIQVFTTMIILKPSKRNC